MAETAPVIKRKEGYYKSGFSFCPSCGPSNRTLGMWIYNPNHKTHCFCCGRLLRRKPKMRKIRPSYPPSYYNNEPENERGIATS